MRGASCCHIQPWLSLLPQNLARLCTVVTECVSAFCVDFWLQTNLFQSGVLWHLLPNLFKYDFTLDEGGVEKSQESNQQVCVMWGFVFLALALCGKNTHNFSACVGIGLGLTIIPHDDVCVNSCMSGLA